MIQLKIYFSVINCLLVLICCAQTKTLKGIVKTETGKPLPYATICLYKNNRSNYKVVAKNDGKFLLNLPENYSDSVLCTYVGYENKFEMLEGNDSINFILKPKKNNKFYFTKEATTNTTVRQIVAKPTNKKIRNQKNPKSTPLPHVAVAEDTECYINETIEIEATYKGGDEALKKYFEKNIIYPDSATIKNVNGVVVVGFTIDITGAPTNIQIIKSVNKYANQAVINVIEKMPMWKPAIQNGSPVNQYLEFSFQFKIINNVTVIKDVAF
jgi:TonB family protein